MCSGTASSLEVLVSECISSFRQLRVYQQAFALGQAVFEESKRWPKDEKYSLTDQLRRSSRSIAANIAEAWAKRRYPAHFVSKLTDADAELQETQHWLAVAAACEYLDEQDHVRLTSDARRIGQMLGHMIRKSATFTASMDES